MFFIFLCFFLDKNNSSENISKYYTSLYAPNSGTCEKKSPCSFSKILKIAKKGNLVCFSDNVYEKRRDLSEFQRTALSLLNKSVAISGNPTLINGTEAGNSFEYFLFCHEISNPCIANFSFKYFKTPVLLISGAENAELVNITISNNYLHKKYSIASFTVSQVSLQNLEIYENTVSSCNVLLIVSTSIIGSSLTFVRNFGTGKSIEPLISIINSGLLIEKWMISSNSAHDSPLIFATSRASMIGLHCNIIKNSHPEIFVNDGSANYTFAYSNISQNQGTVFEGTFESFLHFANSSIDNNFSPNSPLFYLPSGVLSLHQTVFYGNSGMHFALMENVNSSIIISDSSSIRNSFDGALFQLGMGSSLIVNSTINKTFSKVSFINTSNSNACFDNIETDSMVSPLIINPYGTIHLNNNHINYENSIQGSNLKYTNYTYKYLSQNPTIPSMVRAFEHISVFNSEFSFASLVEEYYNLTKSKNETI